VRTVTSVNYGSVDVSPLNIRTVVLVCVYLYIRLLAAGLQVR
jgi:hypothetical protein